MRCVNSRLRLGLALLAWFAQLCLPWVHAASMAVVPAPMAAWCGDPARASAVIAGLPAELRQSLDPDGSSADLLATCAQVCAACTLPPPLPAPAPTLVLRNAGVEPVPPCRPTPLACEPAPRPPSQGPPTLG